VKYLLDTNVVFGALTEAHPHHRACRQWVQAHRKDGLGTCAEVRLAYLRLSMNPEVMRQAPLTASQAWEVLELFVNGAAPGFAASPLPRPEYITHAQRHRDVQDFYLVQIAAEARCKLATNDSRLRKQWPQHTVAARG
jgi:predicted nucleic acid-binding protein